MSTFLLKHPVDISLLTNGFHIQTAFHKLVYSLLEVYYNMVKAGKLRY